MSNRLPSTLRSFRSNPPLTRHLPGTILDLVMKNRSQPADSAETCVPDLVAARALDAPEALALKAGGEAITYRELDRRANQLAHYLINLGAGPESIVGLCLDRSLDSVVCALGILKAGAAYLPLDPAY